MNFKKTTTENDYKEILNQASKCRSEQLQELLNQIQSYIEKTNNTNVDQDLLRAKTIVTSRLASFRS